MKKENLLKPEQSAEKSLEALKNLKKPTPPTLPLKGHERPKGKV